MSASQSAVRSRAEAVKVSRTLMANLLYVVFRHSGRLSRSLHVDRR